MRERLSGAVRWLAGRFGRRIIDVRTGEVAGRAFVFCWRGRVVLVGLDPARALYPVFKTEPRATYWRQQIEFRSHPDPDFPDERANDQRDPDPPAP